MRHLVRLKHLEKMSPTALARFRDIVRLICEAPSGRWHPRPVLILNGGRAARDLAV